MKRISLVIYGMDDGGAERVTANLANIWSSDGRQVTLILLSSLTNKSYELDPRVRVVELRSAPDDSRRFFGVLANIRRILAIRHSLLKHRSDYVIGIMTTSAILSGIAAFGSRTKFIAAERSHPPRDPIPAFWNLLRSLIYPSAHAVVMLTSDGLDWLSRTIPKAKGVVIPNAVVWPLPSRQPRIDPAKVIEPHDLVVLAAGRLDAGKQFDVLIRAFATADTLGLWKLVILGEGDERADLRALIEQLDLGNRVKLPGRAGNMSEWYRRAQIFAMASRFEGFPNALIEAMSHGCPVVSFDCDTGPRDIIRNGIDGYLVPGTTNSVALARALKELMDGAEIRHTMGQRASEVLDRFSAERIGNLWRRLID